MNFPKTGKNGLLRAMREHGVVILYLLQLLFVLMYMEAEIQPFVYVHF